MDRIIQIEIINPMTRPIIVRFLDEIDVESSLWGKTYRPSYGALKMLSRIAKKMEVEFDFEMGVTYLRRRGETK